MQRQMELQNARFESLNQTLINQTQIHQDSVRSELRGVHAAVEAVSSLSQGQANTMIDMLQDIKSQAGAASLQQEGASGALWNDSSTEKTNLSSVASGSDQNSSCSEHRSEGESAVNAELIRSIERLCGLIYEKERTLDTFSGDDDDNDDAEAIIQDLQTILDSAKRQSDAIPTEVVTSQSQQVIGGWNDKEFQRSVRRFVREFGLVELGLNQSSTSLLPT